MKQIRWILALLANLLVAGPNYAVYFGTYTGKGSAGIYVARFDAGTGRISHVGLAAAASNPSFLALHPNGKFLYAVNEMSEGQVSAFSIHPATAKLTRIDRQPSGGADPCQLVVDSSGRALIVANYTSGSASSFPLAADGAIGRVVTFLQDNGSSVNKPRQAQAHVHDIAFSRDNRFAVICDLGMDKLMVYRFDAQTGALVANDPPYASMTPGSGPRHFVFDAAGKHGYAINELASTIAVFDWDAARGALTRTQTISTLPADFHGQNTAAEIAIHPSGRFLYGSNRGDNSLAEFAIDRVTGKLTAAGRFSSEGRTPRSFAIDPTGHWVLAADEDSNNIVEFRVDRWTGALKPTHRHVSLSQPVCVLFK